MTVMGHLPNSRSHHLIDWDWNIHKWSQNIQEEKDRCQWKAVLRKMGRRVHVCASRRKKQNAFCVMRWCQSSKSTFCVAMLTPNTEPSRPMLAFKKNNKLSKNSKSNCDREMMWRWKKKTPTQSSVLFWGCFFLSSACWRCVSRSALTR